MSIDPFLWCKERLMVPGNPLAASLLFVDSDTRSMVLALRAVIMEIAQISELAHEPSLAMAKLNWWREALVENRAHPALEALSVADGRTEPVLRDLLALCESVEGALENQRFETTEQAWMQCRNLGGLAMRIEAQALDSDANEAILEAATQLGAAGYWLRWIRDIAGDAHQERWYVPLDIQADYQINRQQVLDQAGGRSWAGFVRTLVSVAVIRSEQAKERLMQTTSSHLRHPLITQALDQRLASALARQPARILTTRILPSHAGNVWVAWRRARQLRTKG